MTETGIPLSEEVVKEHADRLIATAFRDDTPVPQYGTTPPVPQPGRPPMSQKAVDISTIMLSASAATIPPGAIAVGVMLASGYANPTVIGMICAAPAFVAVPIFAVARLLRGAKEAAPDVHHHHYNAPVDQRHTHSSTRGVWAKTNNQQ
jgi:hypothetical protein